MLQSRRKSKSLGKQSQLKLIFDNCLALLLSQQTPQYCSVRQQKRLSLTALTLGKLWAVGKPNFSCCKSELVDSPVRLMNIETCPFSTFIHYVYAQRHKPWELSHQFILVVLLLNSPRVAELIGRECGVRAAVVANKFLRKNIFPIGNYR